MSDTSTNNNDPNNTNSPPPTPIQSFFSNLFVQLLSLGITLVVGSLCLYACRVAQTNILPTDTNCAPFTDNLANIATTIANINIVKSGENVSSTKLQFPVDENIKPLFYGGIMGFFRYLKEYEHSNVFYLYIATIFQDVIAFNLLIVNWFFNLFNNFLTETLIIFIMPILVIFLLCFNAFASGIYSFYLWFSKLYLFFSSKKLNPVDAEWGKRVIWEDGNMWSIFNWWKSLILIWVFIILYIIGFGPMLTGAIVSFIPLYCLLLPLFMKSHIVEGDNVHKKPYSIKELILNVIKYKMSLIMYIVSFYVVTGASSSFGGYSAFLAILACILLYFFTSIYKQYTPTSNDYASGGLTDYKQAKKICTSRSYAKVGGSKK